MNNNNYYNRNQIENCCVVLLQFHESGCISGIILECARSCPVYHLSFGLIKIALTLRRPGGGGYHPLALFPCNFFDDSNSKNHLSVSVTRDGRHILTYVTSS